MAASFAGQIAVDQLPDGHFISRTTPQSIGEALTRAFGGSTTAFAISAACATTPATHHVHSVLGNFLGPTRTDRRLQLHVTRTRDTKTFATRHVFVSQLLDDGRPRLCAEMIIDFHVVEPALLEYDPPRPAYAGADPEDKARALDEVDILDQAFESGRIDRKQLHFRKTFFTNLRKNWDQLDCLGGVNAQTALGADPHAQTDQEHLPIHDKSSAEWIRLKKPLPSRVQNAAALGFIMDGGLGILPLNFTHRTVLDTSANSTMDFALRILRPDVDLSAWHLRERKAIAGHAGRTIAESRIWDRDGRLVAIESQTSILRPAIKGKPPVKTKL